MQAEQTDQQNQRDDGEDDRVRNHDRATDVRRIAQDGGDRIEFDEFILDRVEIDVVKGRLFRHGGTPLRIPQ
jgi:hypothetical protein